MMSLIAEDRLHGVLFDKDGTLLDFDRMWMEVYRRSAAELVREWGVAMPALDLLEAAGYDADSGRCMHGSALACASGVEIAEIWARAAGRPFVPELGARVDELFVQHVGRAPVPAIENLAGMLDELRQAHLTLGVATMDSEAGAMRALNLLGVADRFSFVAGYDSGYGLKPSAGMLNGFCQHTGLTTTQVVVVGDTLHDIDMGRAGSAGLVVAVLSGASAAEAFGNRADAILRDVSELPDVIAKSKRGVPE